MRIPSEVPALISGVLTEALSAELGLMTGGIASERLLRRLPTLPSSLMSEENRFVRNCWEKRPSLSDDGRLPLISRASSSLSLPSWIPLSRSSSVRRGGEGEESGGREVKEWRVEGGMDGEREGGR